MSAKHHQRVAASGGVVGKAAKLAESELVALAYACIPGRRLVLLVEGGDDLVDHAVIVGVEAERAQRLHTRKTSGTIITSAQASSTISRMRWRVMRVPLGCQPDRARSWASSPRTITIPLRPAQAKKRALAQIRYQRYTCRQSHRLEAFHRPDFDSRGGYLRGPRALVRCSSCRKRSDQEVAAAEHRQSLLRHRDAYLA